MKKIIPLFIVLILLVGVLSACTDTTANIKVEFMNGDKIYDTLNIIEGVSVALPTAPAREGYDFGGWYFDEDTLKDVATIEKLQQLKPPNTVRVYAKWIEKQSTYTITFNTNGGSDVPSVVIKFSEKTTKPIDPTKANTSQFDYEFAGWFTSLEYSTEYDFDSPVVNNVTLYAKFNETLAVYTITFNTNNGNDVPSLLVKFGEKVTKPIDPTKANTNQFYYEFAGWFTSLEYSTEYDFDSPVVDNLTLYAKFDENLAVYTTTFNTNNGNDVVSLVVKFGEKAIKPDDPIKASTYQFDYEFAGWFTSLDYSTEYDFDNTVVTNLTLYARWVENDKLLSYSLDENTQNYTITGMINTNIKEIIIPQTYNQKAVTTIGDNAFSGCDFLTNVTMPTGVTAIGDNAFSYCTGLTDIIIPNSVISIGEFAFNQCAGLASVTIGSGVATIEESAFSGCSGLISILIPNSVTTIGSSAFRHCKFLTAVIIGSSVNTIGKFAFANCVALNKVTIGSSVATIGEFAFSGCSSLSSIIIPNSVTTVEQSAFSGCSGLTDIYCEISAPPISWDIKWKDNCNASPTWGYGDILYRLFISKL